MNEMTIFNFKDKEIRTVMIESEPWWVAKDICDYFGDSDHKRSVSRLDEDEKIIVDIVDSLGRPQNATAVNESGLYTLLFNFQPKKARKDGGAHTAPHIQERIDKVKAFKKWVTSEVLPSIRKTGKFEQPKNLHSDLIDDATTDKMIESFLNSYTRKLSAPKKKVKTRSIKMEVVDSLLNKLEFQIGEVNKTYAEIKELFKGR